VEATRRRGWNLALTCLDPVRQLGRCIWRALSIASGWVRCTWRRRESPTWQGDLPLAQLAQRLLRGVFGRDTRRSAEKALDAAEQLDLDHVLETRRTGN